MTPSQYSSGRSTSAASSGSAPDAAGSAGANANVETASPFVTEDRLEALLRKYLGASYTDVVSQAAQQPKKKIKGIQPGPPTVGFRKDPAKDARVEARRRAAAVPRVKGDGYVADESWKTAALRENVKKKGLEQVRERTKGGRNEELLQKLARDENLETKDILWGFQRANKEAQRLQDEVNRFREEVANRPPPEPPTAAAKADPAQVSQILAETDGHDSNVMEFLKWKQERDNTPTPPSTWDPGLKQYPGPTNPPKTPTVTQDMVEPNTEFLGYYGNFRQTHAAQPDLPYDVPTEKLNVKMPTTAPHANPEAHQTWLEMIWHPELVRQVGPQAADMMLDEQLREFYGDSYSEFQSRNPDALDHMREIFRKRLPVGPPAP